MSIQKDSSKRQELGIVKKLSCLGAQLVPSSGSGRFDGGDICIGDNQILVECKTVVSPKLSFSIKRDWMSKLEEQRFEQGYHESCLAFRFEPNGEDYFIVNEKFFKALIELYLEDNK